MQIEKLQNLLKKAGHGTRLEACTLPCFSRHLQAILPQGKVLILLEEDTPLDIYKNLQQQLHFYRQYVLFIEETEQGMGLFSLPDDIRMVIAVGNRAVELGRIFATLRKCYSVAIAINFETTNLLCKIIDTKKLLIEHKEIDKIAQKAYPVAPLDLILLDETLLQDRREGILKLASCTLIAIDIEIDALFRGERQIESYQMPNMQSANCLELYFASLLESILVLDGYKFSYLNVQALLHDEDIDKRFAFFCYFIERYQAFFQKNLRKYYIPNYLRRFQIAVQYLGNSISLENIEVLTAEQADKLYTVFQQSRFSFLPFLHLLEEYSEKLQQLYIKHSVLNCLEQHTDNAYFATLYNISAESTNMYIPPLLEREFGLLPQPPQKF